MHLRLFRVVFAKVGFERSPAFSSSLLSRVLPKFTLGKSRWKLTAFLGDGCQSHLTVILTVASWPLAVVVSCALQQDFLICYFYLHRNIKGFNFYFVFRYHLNWNFLYISNYQPTLPSGLWVSVTFHWIFTPHIITQS